MERPFRNNRKISGAFNKTDQFAARWNFLC